MKDKSQINWEKLFQGLQDRNINTVKWGTRALENTYKSNIEYKDVYDFRDSLMNTAINIDSMKKYYTELQPYLKDIAIQQIHLDQLMKTDTYGEKYDVNITTQNTLYSIIRGDSISYDKGFIERIDEVRIQEIQKDLSKSNEQDSHCHEICD